MQAVKHIQDTNEDIINIHHINSVGAVMDNYVLFHSPERFSIEIDCIRKAGIVRTRNFFYNLAFIFSALPLIYILFAFDFTLLEKTFTGILISFFLVLGFSIKKLRYVLFISKSDRDLIEFEVNKFSKEDAKKIVRIINKKINKNRGDKNLN